MCNAVLYIQGKLRTRSRTHSVLETCPVVLNSTCTELPLVLTPSLIMCTEQRVPFSKQILQYSTHGIALLHTWQELPEDSVRFSSECSSVSSEEVIFVPFPHIKASEGDITTETCTSSLIDRYWYHCVCAATHSLGIFFQTLYSGVRWVVCWRSSQTWLCLPSL